MSEPSKRATVPSVDDVVSLQGCHAPKQIERYFQSRLDAEDTNHRLLQSACNARAYELAATCKRGKLLAVRLGKRTGCSARFVVDGEQYRTGTWGNGPGYRYAMAGFESWYEKKLRESGLRSKRKIELIISWFREGYVWRSLEHLSG